MTSEEYNNAIRDAGLNDFALRCFRDVADGDYLAARLAYRSNLIQQALWASQQALEKYLKSILLLRRIPWNKPSHSLLKPLEKLETQLTLLLSPRTREFIQYIDTYGPDRYFTFSYYTEGLEIVDLDKAVWEIRRYCFPSDLTGNPRGTLHLKWDMKCIEESELHPPQQFRTVSPGLLDELIEKRADDFTRQALTWKNLYFGKNTRRSLKMATRSESNNSPLALHPELFVEVKKYVHLPKEANQTWRAVQETLSATPETAHESD